MYARMIAMAMAVQTLVTGILPLPAGQEARDVHLFMDIPYEVKAESFAAAVSEQTGVELQAPGNTLDVRLVGTFDPGKMLDVPVATRLEASFVDEGLDVATLYLQPEPGTPHLAYSDLSHAVDDYRLLCGELEKKYGPAIDGAFVAFESSATQAIEQAVPTGPCGSVDFDRVLDALQKDGALLILRHENVLATITSTVRLEDIPDYAFPEKVASVMVHYARPGSLYLNAYEMMLE